MDTIASSGSTRSVVFDLRTIAAAVWYREQRQPEALGPDDLAELLAYTDRASYLAWVSAWKATYAELAGWIRSSKAECRAAQRNGEPKGSRLQAELHHAGRDARLLIVLRRAAKRDSWAKREAAQAAASAI